MSQIFEKLRKMSGNSLTQAQVTATDTLILLSSEALVAAMLGLTDFGKGQMKTSNNGINRITMLEGTELTAYKDVADIWTIGSGTIVYPNGKPVKQGDKCTNDQAKAYLAHDLITFENTVNTAVKVSLSQNQFDALVSLVYNIGAAAFTGSTLLKKLNGADYTAAADQFLVWNKATVKGKKVEVPGLTNRRKSERQLFLTK